jgi:hypothetical protein
MSYPGRQIWTHNRIGIGPSIVPDVFGLNVLNFPQNYAGAPWKHTHTVLSLYSSTLAIFNTCPLNA